jgi:soluble cytochrome b562
LKKKLLSPLELKKFRAEQLEARRIRSEQLRKESKKLSGPKELLDPKPVIEVVEEPVVKEPIELLQEKVDEFSNQYNEELAQLEVRLANKLELDDVNLQPIQNNIKRLRESISELPEVKYYDEEVEKLTERVDELQVSGSEIFQQHGESLKEIKKVTHQMLKDLDTLSKLEIPEAFDPSEITNDIAATKETFYERIAELKKELSELPEVKYYDTELTDLQDRIETVRNSIPEIPEIPEIKYYDDDLGNLVKMIEEVRENIPELPEVRYYENEIFQLEESLKKVEDRIPTVPEVRYYESDIEALREEIKGVEKKIPEIPELPEIKYYDEEVEILSDDIDKVRDNLIDIKLSIRAVEKSVTEVEGREIPEEFDPTGLQIEIEKAFKEIEKLKEQPVTVKEDADPLLPIDQNFVTFDDLSSHYRTFVNRIQQQLMSLGGGGEVNLRYLDDIDRSSISDGKVLSYDAATKKFKFISPGAAGIESNVGIGTTDSINTTGIITASSFSGDGSGLTGIVASGSGIVVRNGGSNVGTAVTIDFGSQLDASFSGGVATINVAISLSDITNVNTSNLSGISTDYLMVYDPSIPGFKFVNPKTYFGINNDSNPSPDIVDYGTY